MPRTPFPTPFDAVICGYRQSLAPDPKISPQLKEQLEHATFYGVEAYDIMLKAHGLPLDDGFRELMALPRNVAVEATRHFRDWLRITREHLLPAIDRVEREERTNISNAQNLRSYADRMESLLSQWDATLPQANVGYRDTELSEEDVRIFRDAQEAGRGKIKFRSPPVQTS